MTEAKPAAPQDEVSAERELPRPGQPALFLGKPHSFWRSAIAAGLSGAGLGLINWSAPNINSPGPAPLLLIMGAILIAGPPRLIERHTRLESVGLWGCMIAYALATIHSLFISPEPEACTLSMAMWLLVPGLCLLGWRMRQQDRDMPALAFVCFAVFRLAMNWNESNFLVAEGLWWLTGLLWCGFVYFASQKPEHPAEPNAPLLAGAGWFVLVVGALTLHEFRYPYLHLNPADRAAAINIVQARPLLGWGVGSFQSLMQEFALRRPSLGDFGTLGYLRIPAEIGIIPVVLAVIGAFCVLVGCATHRPWDRGRYMAAGVFGLWCVALLSGRQSYFMPLFAVSFLAAPAIGRQEFPIDPKRPILPPFAVAPWITVLILVLLPTAGFPVSKWHYNRQYKAAPLEARSILPHWAYPYQNAAWTIRSKSAEIMKFADPRDYLKPVIEEWIRLAPHNELAQIERVRWANQTLEQEAAEAIAREAHERLPWSDPLAMWVVRILHDQGKLDEAITFIEELARERAPLHPALQSRLRALKLERANRSDKNNGQRN